MTKMGYKVVFVQDGRLYPIRYLSGAIEYKVCEKVVPPFGCGPLCVFASKRAAEKFSRCMVSTRIYGCRYRPSNCKHVWWHDGSCADLLVLPPGTRLAAEVTLLKMLGECGP